MNEKDKIIWENVELLRLQRGWTKRYLAELMKSSPQALNNMKSGERGIGKDMLKRFAKAFGVRQAELMQSRKWDQENQQREIDDLKKRVRELENHSSLLESIFLEHSKRLPPHVPEERRALNKILHQIISARTPEIPENEKN